MSTTVNRINANVSDLGVAKTGNTAAPETGSTATGPQVVNNSTLNQVSADSLAAPKTGSSMAPGLGAGLVLSDNLKSTVRALETELAQETTVVDQKQSADQAAGKAVTDAKSKLNWKDKLFGWTHLGDRSRIDAEKQAEAAKTQADTALQAAQATASKTNSKIYDQIASALRSQPEASTFAALEQDRQSLQPILDAGNRLENQVANAINAVGSAINAKEFDNTMDSIGRMQRQGGMDHGPGRGGPGRFHGGPGGGGMGPHGPGRDGMGPHGPGRDGMGPHGPDRGGMGPRGPGHRHGGPGFGGPGGVSYTDIEVMQAKREAQADIDGLQGSLADFKAMLAQIKPDLLGSVGSASGIRIRGHWFGRDNPWAGMRDINNMEYARDQLSSLQSEVQAVVNSVSSQAQGLETSMNAQVSAVRNALRA